MVEFWWCAFWCRQQPQHTCPCNHILCPHWDNTIFCMTRGDLWVQNFVTNNLFSLIGFFLSFSSKIWKWERKMQASQRGKCPHMHVSHKHSEKNQKRKTQALQFHWLNFPNKFQKNGRCVDLTNQLFHNYFMLWFLNYVYFSPVFFPVKNVLIHKCRSVESIILWRKSLFELNFVEFLWWQYNILADYHCKLDYHNQLNAKQCSCSFAICFLLPG